MKNKIIGAALLLVLSLVVFGGCKKKPALRMATGGVTGTYYAYGLAVGQVISEKTKIPISVQSTGASKANIKLIDEEEAELAIVQNDVMDYAWRGVDLFAGEDRINSFSTVAALYAEVCQIVANPASGIKTIADLKGKNVSVGDAGSGTEFNARQILDAYGISFDEIKKHYLGFGASAAALRDNEIDAFFCVAGSPTPAIVDLAAAKEIVILDIDNIHAAQLIQRYPFYTRYPILAGSYWNQANNIMTVAVKATLIASSKLTEKKVYIMTKALFEGKPQIEALHVKGKELFTLYAIEGVSVPFHPGAARYYREIGIIR